MLSALDAQHFPPSKWKELGYKLGLLQPTMDTIEKDKNHSATECLNECLTKWLQGADNVMNKGGATWAALKDALNDMNLHALAKGIESMINSQHQDQTTEESMTLTLN